MVTESLNPLVVADMGMGTALVQVKNPAELRSAIEHLQNNPDEIHQLQKNGQLAIANNRWDNRADQMLEKFSELKGR